MGADHDSAGAALADAVRRGERRAVARAISWLEDGRPAGRAILSRVYAGTGRATLIGITGAPGSGKSTLVDGLIRAYRRADRRVAVLAVDPSSPFSGGAILGDRVRLQAHATDDDVFIRSMATHGRLGGLAPATADAAALLDAAGFDPIVVETAGVGQSEVDIVRLADVSIVVVVPGAGDDVQAMKAGVMEIADLFVVNKADRDGADETVAAIDAMLALDPRDERPAVLRTVATTGRGVDELVTAIEGLRESGAGRSAERRRARTRQRLRDALVDALLRSIDPADEAAAIERVLRHEVDPVLAGEALAAERAGHGDVDHVGVAVESLAEGAAFFVDHLGLPAGAIEAVGDQRVRVRFIGGGETAIELVEPDGVESPLTAFLRRRGPGLHHVAIRVADLDRTIAHLKARSVRLVDEQPRAGAHGRRVAFVHPSAARGVLVELVEDPRGRQP